MCSFYDRHGSPRNLQAAWKFPELPNMEPHYVVRITNTEHVCAIGKDGQRHLIPMRWQLVPPWAASEKMKFSTHNAQSETITEKRTFAAPFSKGRRCLVPVDGFYEFTGPDGAKQPHYFKRKDDRIMAFAGLWESWKGPKDAPRETPLLSYTIITAKANAVAAPIHTRMPVLLTEPAQWDLWLEPAATQEQLLALLVPAPDDLLVTYPVTQNLLKIKGPGPEVLEPVN